MIRVTNNISRVMTAVIPQGSVLEPLVWNVLYNQVLNLPLPKLATSILYTDNLLIILENKKNEA